MNRINSYRKAFKEQGSIHTLSHLISHLSLFSDYDFKVTFHYNGIYTVVRSKDHIPHESVTLCDFGVVVDYLLKCFKKYVIDKEVKAKD